MLRETQTVCRGPSQGRLSEAVKGEGKSARQSGDHCERPGPPEGGGALPSLFVPLLPRVTPRRLVLFAQAAGISLYHGLARLVLQGALRDRETWFLRRP